MRNILVTGAAGFIGSHLSELFVQKGYKVIGLDNLSYGTLQNLSSILGHSQFEFIQGDVRDFELLIELGSRVDAIVHLAAYKIPRYGNALETLDVNVKGIENVLNGFSKSEVSGHFRLHLRCLRKKSKLALFRKQ